MKRIKIIALLGFIVAAAGLVLAGSLPAVAGIATVEPPLADGLPLPGPITAPAPSQPAAVTATGPIQYRTYAGGEFRPAHSDLTFAPVGAAMYALTLPPGNQAFKRPLDLPNGALVTRIDLYAIDNDPVNNITMQLVVNNPGISFAQVFPAVLSTTNIISSPNIQKFTIIGTTTTPIVTIDISQNAYAFRYQPTVAGSAHILVGIGIEFYMPATAIFLPITVK